jgi:hypothetical protein
MPANFSGLLTGPSKLGATNVGGPPAHDFSHVFDTRVANAPAAQKAPAAPSAPQKKKKNLFQSVEGVIGNAGKAIAQPAVDLGHTIAQLNPATSQVTKKTNEALDSLAKTQQAVQAQIKVGKLNPQQGQDATKKIADVRSKLTNSINEQNAATNKYLNPKAVAGNIAQVGSLLVGGGEVAGATKAAKILSAAKTGAKVGTAGAIGTAGATIASNPNAKPKDIAEAAGLGFGGGALLGGVAPIIGKAFKAGTNTATSKVAAKVGEKIPSLGETKGLQAIQSKGLLSAADQAIANAGRKTVYKVSDILGATKPGRALISKKDEFQTHWVDQLSPVYKALKRAEFEGRAPQGATAAYRESVGNVTRANSQAENYLSNDKNYTSLNKSLASRGADPIQTRKAFDEYAKVRSDLELAQNNKKDFTPKKVNELQTRLDKVNASTGGFDKEYKDLAKVYSNLNDFRLKNGLISPEIHQKFKNDPLNYIRQQRQLPDWRTEKPTGKSKASPSSITTTTAVQKRNLKASGEQLSPLETAIQTVQTAHQEALRNQSAKMLADTLQGAGEAKVIRSSADVEQKRALLTQLKEGKPIAAKLDKTLRIHSKEASTLQSELAKLNRQGLDKRLRASPGEAPQYAADLLERLKKLPGKSTNTRELIRSLITEDPKGLAQIRTMIGSRDKKLSPLLDKIDSLSKDLHSLHQERKAIYGQAQGINTTVTKGDKTTLSYLDKGIENVVHVDPAIKSAVEGWSQQSQNVLTNFMRLTNQVFKYGTTVGNIGFGLPNLAGDIGESAANSRALAYTHNPLNFIRSLFDTAGLPLTSKEKGIAEAFAKGNKGALTINQYAKPAAAARTANRAVLQNTERLSRIYTYVAHPKDGAHALFNRLEKVVGAPEELTRRANFRGTYLKAKKQGLSEADAVKQANLASRENSVDFSAMGSYARTANSLYPYFNSPIQGTRQLLRTASQNPVTFAARTGAIVMVPVAMTTIWNNEDPKRKAIYDTIPDYVKQNNFVVIRPDAKWNPDKKQWDGVVIMKKPLGLAAFAEPVRKYIEYAAQNDPGKIKSLSDFLQNQGGNIAKSAIGNLTPISIEDKNKFISSIAPQAIKPSLEVGVNKNLYTGTDIVPRSLQNLPPAEQRYDKGSSSAEAIGKKLNVSPISVSNFIKGTFGEVGTNIQNAVDRLATNNPNEVGGRSISESVKRRFVGVPGGEDTNAFYKAYVPASAKKTQVSKQITQLIQEGKIGEANRRADEFNSSLESRFKDFNNKYANSPTYDPKWNDQFKSLQISKSRIRPQTYADILRSLTKK